MDELTPAELCLALDPPAEKYRPPGAVDVSTAAGLAAFDPHRRVGPGLWRPMTPRERLERARKV